MGSDVVIINQQWLVALGALLTFASIGLGYSIRAWEDGRRVGGADPSEHGGSPL